MRISFFLIAFLVSCATKNSRINNYVIDETGNRKRDGKWVENLSSDNGILQQKGKYKNGEKTGLWITSFQGKVEQKERFRKNSSKIKIYNANGFLVQKGNTKTESSNQYKHWFYDGEWKFYDEKGKHIYTKIYDKGNKVDSIAINIR